MVHSDCSTGSISVAIVDDHPAIREAIGHRVEETIGMKWVAGVGSAGEAIRLIEDQPPDVAVLDPLLSGRPRFDLLEAARHNCPGTGLLVFSDREETVYAERALRAGASGYLMKTRSIDELLAAVRQVAEGETYLSPEMTSRVLQQLKSGPDEGVRFPIDELTGRERQVFRMLGRGLTAETVAERLGLARKTVETHRRRAKEKLGYEKTDEVVSHAARWMLGTSTRRNGTALN